MSGNRGANVHRNRGTGCITDKKKLRGIICQETAAWACMEAEGRTTVQSCHVGFATVAGQTRSCCGKEKNVR